MLCSYEQELCFKHLRKWQFSRGKKKRKKKTTTTSPLSVENPNQYSTGYRRLQVCQSFLQWLCRSTAKKSQMSECSVIRGNNLNLVFLLHLIEVKDLNLGFLPFTWASKASAYCIIQDGVCSSFVWNAKGRGNRNSSFHSSWVPAQKHLEQSLEPSPAGLWFGEKMLEDLFSFLQLVWSLFQRADGDADTALCLPLSWMWENGPFQSGWCGYDFFKYYYFVVDT